MTPATESPERDFAMFVREWFKLIAAGSWGEAFQGLDLPPTAGQRFTPESFRREIEVETFGPNTTVM